MRGVGYDAAVKRLSMGTRPTPQHCRLIKTKATFFRVYPVGYHRFLKKPVSVVRPRLNQGLQPNNQVTYICAEQVVGFKLFTSP